MVTRTVTVAGSVVDPVRLSVNHTSVTSPSSPSSALEVGAGAKPASPGAIRPTPISTVEGPSVTSTVTVAVMPEAEEVDVEIKNEDLRIDVMRAGGPGGQSVNTTDSAVRITHIPTGIVVTSSEKSQHQNRDIAMKALKSRLYQQELDRRNADINAAHEAKGDAGWGNQIRSYVLQPYQMVKDLRTNHETSDTKGVLDGDLDGFMAATLALNVAGKSRSEAQGDS